MGKAVLLDFDETTTNNNLELIYGCYTEHADDNWQHMCEQRPYVHSLFLLVSKCLDFWKMNII